MGEGETTRERELRDQLQAAQAITHIGSWVWTVATNEVCWSDELYRIYGYEPGAIEVTLDVFLSHIRENERERIKAEIQAVLVRPGRFVYREVIIRPDGSERTLVRGVEIALAHVETLPRARRRRIAAWSACSSSTTTPWSGRA